MRYVVVVIVALVVSGCAGVQSKNTVVNVDLWDGGSSYAIFTDKDNIPAGMVTFRGANMSTNDLVHEMLVLKVDSDSPKLPYNEDTGLVPEKKIASLGEISELDPGKSGQLILDLKRGTYLLFCNVPGHYAQDMKTILHVV